MGGKQLLEILKAPLKTLAIETGAYQSGPPVNFKSYWAYGTLLSFLLFFVGAAMLIVGMSGEFSVKVGKASIEGDLVGLALIFLSVVLYIGIGVILRERNP
ncbi:hypothetical protein K3162_11240 [Qipengyuania xiapuensis]|uniref:Uncharacterized protein n=1 Tax=Qipengyuania xiapuensis TaxID=2867236 RepID=A0ABX8ZT70_9SPHN|nr:hypothetical protein [Qipengyuania xiapuensis]QZD92109.1 hypothetical protein K3162_11240 [Qipengyuania xiapuensis]